MEIKSLSYILFLVITMIAYFASCRNKTAQRLVLIIANLSFICFAADIRTLVIVLLLVTFVYFIGIAIEKKIELKQKKQSKALMWLGVIIVIAVLCYFKFFKESFELIRTVLAGQGLEVSELVTPIGLSYYSLSMAAYIIDVYHKKYSAERDFLGFLLFITFFPAIIQGPIGLHKSVVPQFKEQHYFEWNRVIKGLQRILWGYFQKVVIADRIGIIVLGILGDDNSVGFLVFWAMVLYSFQIYTDFSGGIDVIMGVSEILDIKLAENFRAPLVSKSVTEFWQRWHMSLGTFMEKYIYYPIVLNRSVMKFSKKIKNSYMQKVFSATLASIIVFVLVGIWHGTGWNYVVYGCYQALFVSSAVLLGPVYKKAKVQLNINDSSISWGIFATLRTFIILVFGRMFTRARDLTQAIELLTKTFSKWNPHVLVDGTLYNYGLDIKNYYLMIACIIIVIIVDVMHNKGVKIRDSLMQKDIVFRFTVYYIALFAIIILGIYGSEYSSASFIYQGF